MRYRIKTTKPPFSKVLYYPQYRKGWFWRNIGEHRFATSTHNKTEDFNSDSTYVLSYEDALKVIKEFKWYITESESWEFTKEID